MTPLPSTTFLTHLRRAFDWNLGRIVPSAAEAEQLAAAGQTEPAAQRYAVWRRSVLLVTAFATSAAFALAVADVADSGIGDYTPLGVALELAWLATAAALPVAALVGVARWKRPGSGAVLLRVAWAVAFVLPFVYALLPIRLIYNIQPVVAPALALELDPATVERAIALKEMLIDFILAGGGYLMLLPTVLSLIPGALNGCLRVKSLLPAAQLPGWLLVTAAPAFLLIWLVILAVINHAVRSPLLAIGILLWSGSPAIYSLFGRVFVQPQLTDADAARIGRVKKLVGLTALTGIALMAAFILTSRVAGLEVIGFNEETALSTKLDELAEADDEFSLEELQTALAESTSLLYALDLSSYQLIIDILAKLMVVTAVFADLALRATLTAWRNDRLLRQGGSAGYEAAAANLDAALLTK